MAMLTLNKNNKFYDKTYNKLIWKPVCGHISIDLSSTVQKCSFVFFTRELSTLEGSVCSESSELSQCCQIRGFPAQSLFSRLFV